MKHDPNGYLRTLLTLTAEDDPMKIKGLASRLELELSMLNSGGWWDEELKTLVRAQRIAQAVAIVAGYVREQGKAALRIDANGGADFVE